MADSMNADRTQDARVEAAAIALADFQNTVQGDYKGWESMPEAGREYWRTRASTAIDAYNEAAADRIAEPRPERQVVHAENGFHYAFAASVPAPTGHVHAAIREAMDEIGASAEVRAALERVIEARAVPAPTGDEIAKLCETLHQHAMLGGPKAREVGYGIGDADLLLAAENALRNRAVPAPTPDAPRAQGEGPSRDVLMHENNALRARAGQLAGALRALLPHCGICAGREWVTMPDHDPACDGMKCEKLGCPVPVQVECDVCAPGHRALASFDASTKGTQT